MDSNTLNNTKKKICESKVILKIGEEEVNLFFIEETN